MIKAVKGAGRNSRHPALGLRRRRGGMGCGAGAAAWLFFKAGFARRAKRG